MAKEKRGSGFSLKDELFNRNKVAYLAGLFAAADDQFDADGFTAATMRRLKQLELKERIVHIAETLEQYLSDDFRVAAKQIQAALPPPLDPTRSDDDFGDFIFAPLGEFVVRQGGQKSNVKLSLRTLKTLTQRFSMEDAIRYFINEHTAVTMPTLQRWTSDKNYHVRRLVSEGTRPRLPWSRRITLAAQDTMPLLDRLHADPTRYVTRSVANHLNDISKQDPGLVLDALRRWKNEQEQDVQELDWMNRHALRTLVKQGHASSLKFLGFNSNAKVAVSDLALKSEVVRAGESLEFSFVLTARRAEMLIVDYVIDFLKANGKHSPKVHKLKQVSLEKGDSTTIRKRHLLKADASTYRLYPGTHRVTLQINGKPHGTLAFEVC